MVTRLHFDTEALVGETIKIKRRILLQIAYVGKNQYHVRATNIEKTKLWFDKQLEFPRIKGNGRKSFVKLRDFALNAIEGLDYNTERIV